MRARRPIRITFAALTAAATVAAVSGVTVDAVIAHPLAHLSAPLPLLFAAQIILEDDAAAKHAVVHAAFPPAGSDVSPLAADTVASTAASAPSASEVQSTHSDAALTPPLLPDAKETTPPDASVAPIAPAVDPDDVPPLSGAPSADAAAPIVDPPTPAVTPSAEDAPPSTAQPADSNHDENVQPADASNPPAVTPLPPTEDAAPATPDSENAPAAADDSSNSSEPSSSQEEDSNWSLHFLRHCTLATSLILICIGSIVWLSGSKLYRYSPPTLCALLLTLWALACSNAIIAAWSAENGTQPSGPGGAPFLPGEQRSASHWGLDLATASGAASFCALLGSIGGLAFFACILVCSKGGTQYAPKVIASVWGFLLGAIVHTACVSWLLDTDSPETLAWVMHCTLFICIFFCCAITFLHMQRDERGAIIVASAACGSWALVRGLVMILIFIETSSDAATKEEAHRGHELNRNWKWPNEWNLPLLDMAHPSRLSAFDGAASDPSYASSVPYSSLAGSVTQDQIVMNVHSSYYFFLALISMLFIVGASIQSIRPRSSSRHLLQQFTDSKQNSRRGSSALLLGNGGATAKKSGLPPAGSMYRGSSYSEQSLNNNHKNPANYGSLSATSSNGHERSNGSGNPLGGRSQSYSDRSHHRRPASDDLSFGTSSSSFSPSRSGADVPDGGSSDSADLEQGFGGLAVQQQAGSRSMTTSPLKPAKASLGRGGQASKDWSRRTSFSLAINVAADQRQSSSKRGSAAGGHVSRSPSAPVLSAMDDDAASAPAPAATTTATETTHYILSPILGSTAGPSTPANMPPEASLLVVHHQTRPAAAPAGRVPAAITLGGGGERGGVSGSLRRMKQVATALKADKHAVRSRTKKSISFLTECGLVVQPQRTPEPQPSPPTLPISDTVSAEAPMLHGSPRYPSPRDYSAPPAVHDSPSSLVSPQSGASNATPITSPAWSPYPLVTREDLEAEADRKAAEAAGWRRQVS